MFEDPNGYESVSACYEDPAARLDRWHRLEIIEKCGIDGEVRSDVDDFSALRFLTLYESAEGKHPFVCATQRVRLGDEMEVMTDADSFSSRHCSSLRFHRRVW